MRSPKPRAVQSMSSSSTTRGSRDFWPVYGPALVVWAITAGFVLVVLACNHWDPMVFVRLGTRYGSGDPNGTIGYDGQFAYQIALNPLGAAPYLDIPPYRYQRILYPLAAWALALGRTSVVPWTLIAINVLALTIGTHVMGQILRKNQQNPWYALTAGLFAGQLVSLRMDLTEPVALTFALLAVRDFENERSRRAAVFLALSVLSKETSLAFVSGYLAYFLVTKEWRRLGVTALVSLGPFAILQLLLWGAFGEFALRPGGQGATSFSVVPFGGMRALRVDSLEEFLVALVILGPLVVVPCVALSAWLARHSLRAMQRLTFRQSSHVEVSPMAIVVALHVLMMATLPSSTYSDLPGTLRLTSGLVVSTLALGAVIRSQNTLHYAGLWISSVVLLSFPIW